MLRIGALYALVFVIVVGLNNIAFGMEEDVLLGGLVYGLGGVLVFGLLNVLSASELDRPRRIPNEGTKKSARNAILAALFTGLVIACFVGFVLGLLPGLVAGLSLGPLMALFFGGMACLQHLLVRNLLRASRVVPRNHVHFLNYSTELLFLRQIGGGYIFIHRLLLDYFAELRLMPGSDIHLPDVE